VADRFWVGGSGNWDASSTTNWSTASGGSPSASAPTSADDVYFDAGSNIGTGAFTVTVTGTSASPAACKSFFTGGAGGALDGAMTLTMGATAQLDCSGGMTLPASNLSVSGTTGALVRFRSTGSETLTTNGVSLGNVSVTVDGVAGTLTLGSAVTCSTLTVTNGTFSTSVSNYNLTAVGLSSSNSNTRTISLNGSAVTLSSTTPVTFTTSTGLTFNSGTSTITCSSTGPVFAGGSQTFYNVTFSSSTAGFTTSITGANTFNNLTQTSPGSTGIRVFSLSANQTISGALTLGAANTAIRRIIVTCSPLGTQRTITVNGSLAALADVDFRDVNAGGTVATPWTGTRLGDAKNNSNITFATPKTVYWNLAGSQNWSATGWATTNNGSPAANNFPLAQDTATFTEAGSAGTVIIDTSWSIGFIQMANGVSNRTTAFTFTTTISPSIYGNVTLFSNLTFSGTAALNFVGQGVTQTLTSAGVSFTSPVTVINVTGTVQLQDNLTLGSTLTSTLTSGTLDLNGKTLSTGLFASNNSNTRNIAFGTNGVITITGSGASAFNAATGTGLTTSGTGTINMTNASAKTFSGGGVTWPVLNQSGAGALTIAQSNTFTNITNTYAATGATTITFTAGTTQTVSQFTASGASGNVLTLQSSSAGSQFTLSDSSGYNSVSYCSIKDSVATGGAVWQAFTSNGNVNGGNNTGWDFSAPDVVSYTAPIELRSFTERRGFN
jgi:hypothetical protein